MCSPGLKGRLTAPALAQVPPVRVFRSVRVRVNILAPRREGQMFFACKSSPLTCGHAEDKGREKGDKTEQGDGGSAMDAGEGHSAAASRGEGAVTGGGADADETGVQQEVKVVHSVALLALQVYGVDEALLYQVLHVRMRHACQNARMHASILQPKHNKNVFQCLAVYSWGTIRWLVFPAMHSLTSVCALLGLCPCTWLDLPRRVRAMSNQRPKVSYGERSSPTNCGAAPRGSFTVSTRVIYPSNEGASARNWLQVGPHLPIWKLPVLWPNNLFFPKLCGQILVHGSRRENWFTVRDLS